MALEISRRNLRWSHLKNTIIPHCRGDLSEAEALLEQHRVAQANVQGRHARGERLSFTELRRV